MLFPYDELHPVFCAHALVTLQYSFDNLIRAGIA